MPASGNRADVGTTASDVRQHAAERTHDRPNSGVVSPAGYRRRRLPGSGIGIGSRFGCSFSLPQVPLRMQGTHQPTFHAYARACWLSNISDSEDLLVLMPKQCLHDCQHEEACSSLSGLQTLHQVAKREVKIEWNEAGYLEFRQFCAGRGGATAEHLVPCLQAALMAVVGGVRWCGDHTVQAAAVHLQHREQLLLMRGAGRDIDVTCVTIM